MGFDGGNMIQGLAQHVRNVERSRGWDCSHGFPVPLC